AGRPGGGRAPAERNRGPRRGGGGARRARPPWSALAPPPESRTATSPASPCASPGSSASAPTRLPARRRPSTKSETSTPPSWAPRSRTFRRGGPCARPPLVVLASTLLQHHPEVRARQRADARGMPVARAAPVPAFGVLEVIDGVPLRLQLRHHLAGVGRMDAVVAGVRPEEGSRVFRVGLQELVGRPSLDERP